MKTSNKLIFASLFLLIFASVIPGVVQAQNYLGLCSYHSYQICSGNNLYWYDSCGNQQDLAQYCSGGCYGNSCNYNNYNYNYQNYNYNNCTYHAYKLCQGNSIYWYDSCGNAQDLYYSCGGGQTCQYGQCTSYIINPVLPPVQPYVAYFKTACYAGSLYWYDSLGVASGLYKNCVDSNSCTIDACSTGKCSNTIKCDGTTCAIGSADYNSYCLPAQSGAIQQPTQNTNNLTISLFVKQDANSSQWQKTADVGPNSTVYFMATAINGLTAQINNVNVSTNIPAEISSLGNVQINGVPVSGDIVSGINIGSIAPTSSKSITFEGKTQTFSAIATKQATATSNVSGVAKTDSISLNFNPSIVQATVSASPATSGFVVFLKKWYLWILGGLVLIALFIIVFRRLSSNV